ncbi:TetR/AcrR family transcriptional regulator [Nocardia harenae]|uniref:TetR/AcrR family transcriptional regulator n=1 Tax=Nocardia harenae TaxID=358707 RepID=UPI000829D192|nr:TetR/AcrR family transcriptional regulator [Nocardia harenae]
MNVRDRVLHAALECFSEDGYERTSITRIRERSGVSNGALFHHFGSKEAIAGTLYVEAMGAVHAGYREVLSARPATVADGVGGVIAQQLSWVESDPVRARFVYSQGRLDWASEPGERLRAMNEEIAAAYREWLTPFVATGAVRDLPMAVIVAIVTGPAHALAQQWLAGQLSGTVSAHLDDLVDAAVAGLSGSPAPPRPAAAAVRGRLRIQLLDAAGGVLAEGETEAALRAPR